MKSIKILIYTCFLLFLMFSCNLNPDSNSKFTPDITSVMNFSNYTSIGVASKASTLSRNARTANTDSFDILVGLNKKTDLLEKVSFISSDDSETTADFYVCAYQDTTPFLFVQFSKSQILTQGYFDCNTSDTFSPIYAISKKTGKIFNLGDIIFSNDICYRHNGNKYTIMGNITYSNDSVFISRCNLDSDIKYIYKISEESNHIKIEKYCRVDVLGSDGWGEEILADIYGNLLSLKGNYLTANKELRHTEDGNWVRTYDGKLYKENCYLDSSGNICEDDFSPNPYFLFSDEELIYKNGLEYWYYCINDANSSKKSGTGHFQNQEGLYKVTFTDETKHRYTGELIKKISSEAIRIGNRFFCLKNGMISYYDYLTNTDNYITVSNCTVITIEEGVGGIIYKGYGPDLMSTIEGFINAETLESSDTTKIDDTLFTPIYLAPLN
ncbi:MAG: hypothetical protein ACI4LT_00730 [Treponema sp.]